MTPISPPFGGRLLRRLVPAQDHDALLGDLQEERQRGRSRAWYIAQILAAIIVGSWKDIRTHRLLAFRAIGIGIAALVLYFFAAGALLNFVQRRLYEGILVGNHWIYWRERPQSWIFVRYVVPVWVHVGFLVSGWVIGRLYRAHGITFVVAFAAFVQLLFLVLYIVSYILLVSHIMAPSSRVGDSSHDVYVSPLWMSLCIVIGGYFATRRAEAA
jgi:hypothetical protein